MLLPELTSDIVLADGQALTALGIRYLIEKELSVKVTDTTERDVLFGMVTPATTLAIIDYQSVRNFEIPDFTRLRSRFPELPVLVITNDRNKASILQVLEEHVNGFLFKDCFEDEISRAIGNILKGENFYCNKVVDILMQQRQQENAIRNLPVELTLREIDIIKLVVTGHSTLAIAEKLYLSPHTVSTHRKNISRKLKIKSPVELVNYAYDLGLIHGGRK